MGGNTNIEECNSVIVLIIGGYKRFIHAAYERVCSDLAFIVNYNFSSIDFSFIKDIPTPHLGYNPHNVFCDYISKKLLTE